MCSPIVMINGSVLQTSGSSADFINNLHVWSKGEKQVLPSSVGPHLWSRPSGDLQPNVGTGKHLFFFLSTSTFVLTCLSFLSCCTQFSYTTLLQLVENERQTHLKKSPPPLNLQMCIPSFGFSARLHAISTVCRSSSMFAEPLIWLVRTKPLW